MDIYFIFPAINPYWYRKDWIIIIIIIFFIIIIENHHLAILYQPH